MWYDSPAAYSPVANTEHEAAESEIDAGLSRRGLDRLQALSPRAFPLVRRHAQRYVLQGLALVGDAAHTINPLAGQGVNLGYRDVDALLMSCWKARAMMKPGQTKGVLKRYQTRSDAG